MQPDEIIDFIADILSKPTRLLSRAQKIILCSLIIRLYHYGTIDVRNMAIAKDAGEQEGYVRQTLTVLRRKKYLHTEGGYNNRKIILHYPRIK
jgi:hypothetical protein